MTERPSHERLSHMRPRADDDRSPNYIASYPRHRFPTQAEAEQRLLAARNRRRAAIARTSLVLMALAPFGVLANVPPFWMLSVSLAATVVFVACCVVGAHQNERR